MIHKYFIIILICIKPLLLFSQPEIKAVFTKKAPAIDGFVTEDDWKNGAVINDFYQREPKTGEPITEKTEFLFLFDQNNIYIGIRCYDDPRGITAKELARDVSLGEDDRVQVIFDTFLDGRSGYWFQIGPRGSIGDALINENGKDFNKSWDGIWDGKARITDHGWEAEMIIPFKTIAFKINVTFNPDGTWTYEEDTVLQIQGQSDLFHHTDKNILTKIAEPTPNPLALKN